MGVVKKIPRPPFFPGKTVWGSVGECVHVGEIVEGVNVYLSERESREVLAAWKWPRPEEYEKLSEQNRALSEALTDAENELRGLRKLAEALAEFKVSA